jgi:hypothetical protein
LTKIKAETGSAESATALELLQLQLARLERNCLAVAARNRGPLH